jgi:hypothetical protein
LPDLTVDERRGLFGFPEAEKTASDSANKVADSLSAMSPLVANKVLDSMTDDEIRSLIGLGPKTGTTPPPLPTDKPAI